MITRLQLKSITCIQAQETTDELYVTFNGTKVALPNMTVGRTKALNHEFKFGVAHELRLFENDGDHWYDRDDFIGRHTIAPAQAPANVSLDFVGGNAHYVVDILLTPA